MKKRLRSLLSTCFILFFSSFLFPLKSSSQHLSFNTGSTVWEAGFEFGPTFFLGDLGGHAGKGERFIKDVNLQYTHLVKGIFASVYPNDWIGFRFTAQKGFLQGQDDIISTKGVNELWRKQRNLDFNLHFQKHIW